MQYWYTVDKNMELSKALIARPDNNVGLALYHAQQALEMAVKACIFRFDFERFLNIKEANDSKSEIEYVRDRTRKVSPLHTHFPISELIYSSFGFIESQARKISKTGNPEFDQSLSSILEVARMVRDFVDYIAPPKGANVSYEEAFRRKKELWKLSLRMQIEDKKIDEFITTLTKAAVTGGTVSEFTTSTKQYIRAMLDKLSLMAEKSGKGWQLEYRFGRATDILKRSGIPEELVFLFRHDRGSAAYDAAVEDFVREQGMWPILIRLFSPKGAMNEIQRMRLNTKVAKIKGARLLFPFLRSNFIWMGYMASIAHVMIFLFPHEEFGRYLQTIDDVKTTEEIYVERKEHAIFLVDECEKACKTIKLILDNS